MAHKGRYTGKTLMDVPKRLRGTAAGHKVKQLLGRGLLKPPTLPKLPKGR